MNNINSVSVISGEAQGDRPEGWGLVFTWRGVVLSLSREINLSRFATVLDMEVNSGLLLVDGKSDTLRRWGLYDLGTGKYRTLGLKRGRTGFFLSADFSRHLESFWK